MLSFCWIGGRWFISSRLHDSSQKDWLKVHLCVPNLFVSLKGYKPKPAVRRNYIIVKSYFWHLSTGILFYGKVSMKIIIIFEDLNTIRNPTRRLWLHRSLDDLYQSGVLSPSIQQKLLPDHQFAFVNDLSLMRGPFGLQSVHQSRLDDFP